MRELKLPENIDSIVALALAEDVGSGDVTAELIDVDAHACADIICRDDAVVCGTAWFESCFRQLDSRCRVKWHQHDGDSVTTNTPICTVEGPARALVTGERTALNFLQTLSGTATATRRYVADLKGSRTQLLDTRKTIPLLRAAQKYAVVCGGGKNHRLGLFDAVLIKENHIAAAGSLDDAIRRMRAKFPNLKIEIEVESLADVEAAIAAGADMLLLDNFSIENLAQAVAINAERVELEASGGFELDDLSAVARTGVHFISVGALTKHLAATDYSMRFRTNS